MEQNSDRPEERKDMDNCLRRLKQELVSMKEAGDGLHNQMNSMMGALQELKLLQVQTALGQLEISNKTRSVESSRTARSPHRPVWPPSQSPSLGQGSQSPEVAGLTGRPNPLVPMFSRWHSPASTNVRDPVPLLTSSPMEERSPPPPRRVHRRLELQGAQQRGSLSTSPSFSSSEEDSFLSRQRFSRDSGTCWDTPVSSHGCVSGIKPSEEDRPVSLHPARMAELQSILDSLSREGPSIDSDFSQDDPDDSSDWTSSLMSHSRNRQPLVLGDTVFAELVGNWLDLPELEARTAWEDEEVAPSVRPLQLSRSQEFCRRLSLTANIFKKVLHSVRPDRDKLLKERPGWMPPEDSDTEVFKRPKKARTPKPKGQSFYRPFWARASGQKGKARSTQGQVEERDQGSQGHAGVRGWPETTQKQQPLFDYSTALWV